MTLATDQSAATEDFSPHARAFLSLRAAVMDHWEREVRARIKGAAPLRSPVLTNTLPAFYDNIAEALSPAHHRRVATSNTNAAAIHGDERARMTCYSPDHIVHEYQIFREAITFIAQGRIALTWQEHAIIDESINAAMREAVRAFTDRQADLRHKVAAALSHDMRTPLAVISNGAQLVGLASSMDMARRVAAKIGANADRLSDMMNDLLDALTSPGEVRFPLQLTLFDMMEMVNEAMEQYCEGSDCKVSVESSTSVAGYWCRNSMRRALENLINNAIKYGNQGTVSIKVAAFRERLMLSVHNMGNPIPKASQDRIFHYLERDHSADATIGWGIGLQFVKSIAEGHGGSVTVDSSTEAGTTFLIDIPVDCRPYVSEQLQQHG